MESLITKSGHEIAWDGNTVWVNSNKGRCVARLGRMGYEVNPPGQASSFLRKRDGYWQEFQKECLDLLQVEIPEKTRPKHA